MISLQMKRVMAGIFLMSIISMEAEAKVQGQSIQIKGSDTMINLAQAWAEVFMEKNSESFIAVTGGGSGTGIAALLNGTCDIAASSRLMTPPEKDLAQRQGLDIQEYKVALDGLAVVVHPQNPVSQLTVDQIADIFKGKITHWQQLGGPNGPIVILSREVNSGTHVYFKEHVLRHGDPQRQDEFSDSALMMPSSQAIVDEISQNIYAIGYYGMGYVDSSQKALKIARDINSPFYEPSIDNVIQGHYYISRPLLIYTAGQSQGEVKKFIDFILSAEGQEIVRDNDFVPLPKR